MGAHPSLPSSVTGKRQSSWREEASADRALSYPGIGSLESASNPGVGVVDRQIVLGTAGEDSAEVAQPWQCLRGMLDSTHWRKPADSHSASGVQVAEELFASGGVAYGMTWCELDPEKIGGSAKSSSANVPVAVLRQRSLKMQRLAGN